jgi:hypothetical protein
MRTGLIVPEFPKNGNYVSVPDGAGAYIFFRLDMGDNRSVPDIFSSVKQSFLSLYRVSITSNLGYLAFQSPATALNALKSLSPFTFASLKGWYNSRNNRGSLNS